MRRLNTLIRMRQWICRAFVRTRQPTGLGGKARPLSLSRSVEGSNFGPRPKWRTCRLRLPALGWRAVAVTLVGALLGADPNLRMCSLKAADCSIPSNPSTPTSRSTLLGYDQDGRTTQVNSPEGVINFGYDAATGRHATTCTANSEIAYGYDELGRLRTVSVLKRNGFALTNAEVTTYAYTGTGGRQSVTMPNGVISIYTYDILDRLTNLTHTVGGTNLLASFSYKLHPTGRRTNAVEVIRSGISTFVTNTISWRYDAMYRLTNEVSDSTLSSGQYSDSYEYDLVGNRLRKVHIQVVTPTGWIIPTTRMTS
jgi:YD repeat-containing protein